MERAWARALRPEPNSWLAVNKPNFEKLKEWSILNLIVFIGKKLGLEGGLMEILGGSSGLIWSKFVRRPGEKIGLVPPLVADS